MRAPGWVGRGGSLRSPWLAVNDLLPPAPATALLPPSPPSSCRCPPCVRPQVERYKALLLKQRDIMIALTQRLNERDNQILGLQAELEAYDSQQK